MWVGICGFLLSVCVFFESSRMPDFGASVESPGMFPAFLAISMALLSICLVVGYLRAVRFRTAGEGDGAPSGSPRNVTESCASRRQAVTVVFVCVLGFVYIFLLPRVHFFWDTLGFLIVLILSLTPRASGSRKRFQGVLVAVLATLAIQFLFAGAFRLLLP